MFFLGKDRLNEDLENIRKSNLSPEELEKEESAKEAEKRKIQNNLSEFTWKDVVAMTIAIIEVILPYMLAMAAAMAGMFLFIYWLAHH